MAALTTLDNIKAVSQDDSNIQGLHDSDKAVVQALNDVAFLVPSGRFGTATEILQRYLGAHLLSLAFQAVGGQGPLSSETIGGITQSFTLPYLNQKTVYGSTQYGLHYLDLLSKFIPLPRVITV
jgi:hypothetical protein